MSQTRMAQESAQIILRMYKDNNLRPGQMLMHLGLEYRFVTGQFGSIEEFKAGMAYAIDHKWIELKDGEPLLPERLGIVAKNNRADAA
jgi:hypothetical protein